MIRLNNEQKMIESEVKKFAQSELEPIASEIDKKGVFPDEIVKKLSTLGLSSLIIPEKYGGAGLDITSLCIAVEELAAVCASVSLIFAVNNSMVAYPIMEFGSEEIKGEYLKRISHGDIAGYAIEDDSSSNTDSLISENKNGLYNFVLNGEVARFMILPVNTGKGKNLYIYDRGDEDNIKRHRILGMRAAGICGLEINSNKLTDTKALLTAANAKEQLCRMQSCIDTVLSALSVGLCEAAYNSAVEYSKERRQFGRSICDFPMIQEMLIDMKTQINAAKLLVFDAAAQFDTRLKQPLKAHIARLFASKAAVNCGLNAIQIFGGYGYTKEYPVERFMRDAKTIQLLNATGVDLMAACAKELI